MLDNIIFLKAILNYKNWGKNDFLQFGYANDNKQMGEMVLLSDIGTNINKTLNTGSQHDDIRFIYQNNRNYFNNKNKFLPVEIKLICTSKNTEPMFLVDKYFIKDNMIPNTIEQKKFILNIDNKPIQIGLNFKTNSLDQTKEMLLDKNLFDFNYITLNPFEAILINKNNLYMINQDSLIYVIDYKNGYEFDLKDFNKLNYFDADYIANTLLEKANDINIPSKLLFNTNYIKTQNFKIQLIDVVGIKSYTFDFGNFTHLFVIDGDGKIDKYNISKGSNMIVKSNVSINICGNLKIIAASVAE